MMLEGQNICPNCFEHTYRNGECSRCGYQSRFDKRSSERALPIGTVLHDRYYVGRLLGEGGFGLTYKVYDMQRNMICAVKEYAPNDVSRRSSDYRNIELISSEVEMPYRAGLRRFLDEAQILSKLEQIPSVVDITDSFQENSTAYFAMEYLDGADLRQIVQATKGRLPVEQATNIILQVALSMDVIHTRTKIIHRDISPENIYITKDKKIKLIDFGSAKQTVNGSQDGFSVVLKPKFAPPEQFSSQMVQGSFTDVYSLASTYYYALTGSFIPPAPDRVAGVVYLPLKQMNLGILDSVSDAVDRALNLNVSYRTQTMQEFVQGIAPAARSRSAYENEKINRQREEYLRQQQRQKELEAQKQRELQRQRQMELQRKQAEQEAQRQRQLELQRKQAEQEARRQREFQQRQLEARRQCQQQSGSQNSGNVSGGQQAPGRKQTAVPYVSVIAGKDSGKSWVIPPNQCMKLGRSSTEVNLRIENHIELSRIHCYITYLERSKTFRIRDVSTYGVFYQGRRLNKDVDYELKPPLRLALASTACIIEVGIKYEYH